MSRIADQVGRVLGGRYRLLAPIGTGASAHVYSADDVKLRRRVAVKVLHAALADDDAFLRRFRAEATTVATLRHPNIMNVYDWGEDEGSPFLVLELLGGGSLRSMLDRGHRLTPSQTLVVGLEAARALDHAHRRGLVHRDIKPANLLFDEEGRLCVADFGVARALAEAAWTEPAGAVLGTARYASPEQVEGATVDGKADVYALALVLIEAVTGQVPFAADTTIATLMGRVGKDVVVPAELGPLVPVLEHAGRADRDARLDAAALIQGLDRAARTLPGPAPLPLAGATPVDDATVLTDLTVLPGRAAPVEPEPARREPPRPLPGGPVPFDYDRELSDEPTVVTPVGPTVATSDRAATDPVATGRGRRRWPLVAAICLVAALVAGGAAYAVVQARVPTHPVPDLKGKTIDQARAAVRIDKFKIKQTSATFEENVPKDAIARQLTPVGHKLKEGATVRVVVSQGPQPRPVPDLTGKTVDEAKNILAPPGLVPDVVLVYDEDVAQGIVMQWEHKGEALLPGTHLKLTVSNGPQPRSISDWRGKSYDDAAAAFAKVGLTAVRKDVFDDTVPAGQIVSTSPAAGGTADKGSTVTVNVSKGPDMVTVPDVTGMTVADASSSLQQAGLIPGSVFGKANKRVFITNPTAGQRAKRGTTVDLYTTS